MVAGVLTQTNSLDPFSQIHQPCGNEWKEDSASLLPDRGDIQTSYSPCQGRTPWVLTYRCDPVGLASSPLRIEPHCEKGHPREVQTREGKETTTHQRTREVLPLMVALRIQGNLRVTWCNLRLMGVALARAHSAHFVDIQFVPERPDSRPPVRDLSEVSSPFHQGGGQASPTFGWVLSGRQVVPVREQEQPGTRQIKPTSGRDQLRDESTNTRGDVLTSKTNWKLPPLPERAIRGLTSPWSSPNGELFHTVSLWEFTNLYVLLGEKDWTTLSKFLKGVNLLVLSHQLKIGYAVLLNIRDNHSQSIVVPNLRKLCEKAELNLDSVERSIRGVRFNTRGSVERLKFPFAMDIYAWRTLCHIVGDGNIHKRKYPNFRWIQLPENQEPMRELLKRLSRPVGGESDQIWYPKALTYAMMGTMPGLTLRDLRSPKFLQFVIDLPMSYKDWKVEFLAAFIVDDGCVSKDISFTQKDEKTLQSIIRLCDQLGYDHSHIYRHKRDGMHNFQLRQQGIEAFYIDMHKLVTKDPLLGLWHKHPNFQSVATSFSMKRGYDNRQAVEVCITIITILGDHLIRSTDELSQHCEIKPFLEGQPWYYLNRRLRKLYKMNLIQEVLKPTNTSYRPKRWVIPPSRDPETLIKKFHAKYGNRAHKQSYKRIDVTVEMANSAKARLIARGVKPNPTNTAREGGFSRKLFYERADLRALFEDEE